VTPVLLECPEVPLLECPEVPLLESPELPLAAYVLEILGQSGVEKCTLEMESDIPAEKFMP